MDKKDTEYVGKEMYGFRFEDFSFVEYNAALMDRYIDKVGIIVDDIDDRINVSFKKGDGCVWTYPKSMIDEHLVKPIDINELFKEINAYYGK